AWRARVPPASALRTRMRVDHPPRPRLTVTRDRRSYSISVNALAHRHDRRGGAPAVARIGRLAALDVPHVRLGQRAEGEAGRPHQVLVGEALDLGGVPPAQRLDQRVVLALRRGP